MSAKDVVDRVLGAMRTPGSRPWRTRNGIHSPTLLGPRAERMTVPRDGYGLACANRGRSEGSAGLNRVGRNHAGGQSASGQVSDLLQHPDPEKTRTSRHPFGRFIDRSSRW